MAVPSWLPPPSWISLIFMQFLGTNWPNDSFLCPSLELLVPGNPGPAIIIEYTFEIVNFKTSTNNTLKDSWHPDRGFPYFNHVKLWFWSELRTPGKRLRHMLLISFLHSRCNLRCLIIQTSDKKFLTLHSIFQRDAVNETN